MSVKEPCGVHTSEVEALWSYRSAKKQSEDRYTKYCPSSPGYNADESHVDSVWEPFVNFIVACNTHQRIRFCLSRLGEVHFLMGGARHRRGGGTTYLYTKFMLSSLFQGHTVPWGRDPAIMFWIQSKANKKQGRIHVTKAISAEM